MRHLSFIVLLLLAAVLTAQAPDRPTVGLVLSGGGAKGLAHIGVLRVLEENGIVPDFVAGTSMGSIVGGLYAIGYTPYELDSLARGLAWDSYFNDQYARSLQPIEERARADRYQLSFAWEDGQLQLPRGLIDGHKIATLLAGLTAPVHDQDDFDRFYLPYRCVATDLEDGSAYVFRSGDLRHAIRASMSIPSAFAPLVYEDRLLVDGMLARNLPVREAVDMGADFIIAVDVGDPLYERDELTSVVRVMEQTSSFGMAASTRRQRELADFIIDPELEPYGALSYNAADSLIARGVAVAQDSLPALQRALGQAGISAREAPERPQWRRDSFPVVSVHYDAPDAATKTVLAQLFTLELPRTITIARLTRQVGQLYASGFFSSVDYAFQRVTGGYELLLHAKPGPRQHLRGSVGYDNDQNAALLLNYTTRNRLLRGSVLSVDLRVSEYPGLWLDYGLYTRSNPSIGFRWRLEGDFSPGWVYEDGRAIGEFSFQRYRTTLELQTGIKGQWFGSLGAGLEHRTQHARVLGFGGGDAQLNRGFLFARLLHDTYDRTYFPTCGGWLELWGEYTLGGDLRELVPEDNRQNLRGNVLVAAKGHKIMELAPRWWVEASGGVGVVNYRQRHLLNLFYLGRELPMQQRHFEVYGLRLMEQPASAFGYGGLKVRTEVGQRNYVGLGYNLGYYLLSEYGFINEGGSFQRPETEGRFHGLGLELGSLTPIGPVRLTAEYNLDRRRFNFSFYAGYRF